MKTSSRPVLAVLVLLGALGGSSAAQHGTSRPRLSPITDLAKGKLLVAREGMPDPRFARTVVLLVDQGEHGAAGVILNRPTEMQVGLLFPGVKKLEKREDPLYFGGPVAPTGMLVLLRGKVPKDTEAEVLLEDVTVSSDQALLEKVVASGVPPERLRVFSGYAGWAPGQLESEVRRGDWFIWPADADTVFSADPGEATWRRLLDYGSSVQARFDVRLPPACVRL